MARRLHIDIETFSSVDIKTSGAYKYIQSLDFRSLVAYAFDDEPIKIIDWPGEELPQSSSMACSILYTEMGSQCHSSVTPANMATISQ